MKAGKVVFWGGCTNNWGKKKNERERYIQLNTGFQRIARKDKKAFLSKQWKGLGGKNRIRMTRDFFKKIGDMKGIFHAKMGPIKDRNGKELTETEEI